MKKNMYQKLVRDRVPELIEKSNKTCVVRILDDTEYVECLKAKLFEETKEYLESENNQEATEELADLIEVIYALANTHDVSSERLEQIRLNKLKPRGAFENKVYLEYTEENV